MRRRARAAWRCCRCEIYNSTSPCRNRAAGVPLRSYRPSPIFPVALSLARRSRRSLLRAGRREYAGGRMLLRARSSRQIPAACLPQHSPRFAQSKAGRRHPFGAASKSCCPATRPTLGSVRCPPRRRAPLNQASSALPRSAARYLEVATEVGPPYGAACRTTTDGVNSRRQYYFR